MANLHIGSEDGHLRPLEHICQYLILKESVYDTGECI